MTSHASEAPRILFFDVDGTLIYHKPGVSVEETVANARPSDGVARAFHELRERGHLTFICTGRPLALMADSLLALEPSGIISSAGSCVSLGDEILFDEAVDPAFTDRVAACSDASGVPVLMEATGGDVAYAPAESIYGEGAADLIVRTREELRVKTDMRFTKFVIYASDLEALKAVDPTFFDEHFSFFDLGLGIVEFTAKGVDKGYGVRRTLECLGRGREGTFAFGDSENDLPMAGAVETFVAMGNAMPEVKARAAYVTDPVQDDGVVTALEHFGLL